jgi:hypothetical protein
MIPLYPQQLFQPSNPIVTPSTGIGTNAFFYLVRALFNRTGGPSGITDKVGNNLTAVGTTLQTALALSNDYNEVLNGDAGVSLAALQPGQRQWVLNGTGGNLNVYPCSNGAIDALGSEEPYILANGKTQIFVCYSLLTTGGSFYRSTQLG